MCSAAARHPGVNEPWPCVYAGKSSAKCFCYDPCTSIADGSSCMFVSAIICACCVLVRHIRSCSPCCFVQLSKQPFSWEWYQLDCVPPLGRRKRIFPPAVSLGFTSRESGGCDLILNLRLSCLQESGAISPKVLSSICPAAILDLHVGVMQQQSQPQAMDSTPPMYHVHPVYSLQQISRKVQPSHPFSSATSMDVESAPVKHCKNTAFQGVTGCLQYQELWSALRKHPSLLEEWAAFGYG